mmetsp:Transcript_69288/g.144452  ORF Transcript_69288/g.144452 Transcript_69288/m.144452 type:complete len:84 (-) Transcript_69288:165-416(-)
MIVTMIRIMSMSMICTIVHIVFIIQRFYATAKRSTFYMGVPSGAGECGFGVRRHTTHTADIQQCLSRGSSHPFIKSPANEWAV